MKTHKQWIVLFLMSLWMTSSVWALGNGTELFVVKPWLHQTVWTKDDLDQNHTAPIELFFQIENLSNISLILKDLNLSWAVYGINGTSFSQTGNISLNQHGAPPFTEFSVWAHGSLIDPVSDLVTPQIKLNLPPGDYSYIVSIVDPQHANQIVLSSNLIVHVVAAGGPTGGTTPQRAETPLGTAPVRASLTSRRYPYTMGYEFVPQADGKITKLGGLFQGTKTVYLYNSSGSVLALASVTGNNTWTYAPITPVTVKSGQTYTVAVALAGSGGSYQVLSDSLPKTFGNVRILTALDHYDPTGTGAMPTTRFTSNITYGQADVEFVPGP